MRVALIILISCFCSVEAWSDVDWRESTMWSSASVLSQGQHRWAARVSQQSIRNRFSEKGTAQPLGQAYAKNWSWRDILSAEKDAVNQAALSEYIETHDIGLNETAAMSELDLRRDETLLDLSWAYGVSERWMFGFFLPISHVRTETHSKVTVSATATDAVQHTQTSSEGLGQKNAEEVVQQLVSDQIARQGFRAVSDQTEKWIWGDLSILNQFLVYNHPDQRFSLQQILKIPTSRNPSLSDYIQTSRDDGQIDVGVSGYWDRNLSWSLLTISGGYINQLAAPIRVTQFGEDGQRMNDQEISRDLGNIWWAGSELKFDVTSKLSVSGGYRYLTKGEDKFNSTQLAEKRPGQDLQLVRALVSYVFTDVESRYEIEKKWALNLQVQSAIAGRNADEATSAALELQTYF